MKNEVTLFSEKTQFEISIFCKKNGIKTELFSVAQWDECIEFSSKLIKTPFNYSTLTTIELSNISEKTEKTVEVEGIYNVVAFVGAKNLKPFVCSGTLDNVLGFVNKDNLRIQSEFHINDNVVSFSVVVLECDVYKTDFLISFYLDLKKENTKTLYTCRIKIENGNPNEK